MKRVSLAILALALAPLAAPAQQAPATEGAKAAQPEANPVSSGLRELVETESADTVAAVEEMPADKFNFRPTPQQNTFGHLVVHMIRANYGLCRLISGVSAPKLPDLKDDDPKDALIGPLKASFDFCAQSFAHLEDSQLGAQVPFIGGKLVSRGFLVVTMAEDYGDHYSTAAMYLRLNGLLPPTAQPRKQ
ncbi:MAG TPA: DinB family protein [Candidatus Acidoferrales bacterium]|nr:DinB family protein [Candidatus Acidoferrales bacterium]